MCWEALLVCFLCMGAACGVPVWRVLTTCVCGVGRDENPTFEVLQRINCGTVNETTSLNAWLLSPLAS